MLIVNKFTRIKQEMFSVLRPIDVINTEGNTDWYEFWLRFVYGKIHWAQKRRFGKGSDWRHTHTMMCIDPGTCPVFSGTVSTTVPKGKWESVDSIVDARPKRISIYRCQYGPFTEANIDYVRDLALANVIGKKYDMGQLMCIALNLLYGTDDYHIKWFDFSPKQRVCSATVRFLFEMLRKHGPENELKRLFTYSNGRKTNIEMTMPAHFANSALVDGSFKKIAEWVV